MPHTRTGRSSSASASRLLAPSGSASPSSLAAKLRARDSAPDSARGDRRHVRMQAFAELGRESDQGPAPALGVRLSTATPRRCRCSSRTPGRHPVSARFRNSAPCPAGRNNSRPCSSRNGPPSGAPASVSVAGCCSLKRTCQLPAEFAYELRQSLVQDALEIRPVLRRHGDVERARAARVAGERARFEQVLLECRPHHTALAVEQQQALGRARSVQCIVREQRVQQHAPRAGRAHLLERTPGLRELKRECVREREARQRFDERHQRAIRLVVTCAHVFGQQLARVARAPPAGRGTCASPRPKPARTRSPGPLRRRARAWRAATRCAPRSAVRCRHPACTAARASPTRPAARAPPAAARLRPAAMPCSASWARSLCMATSEWIHRRQATRRACLAPNAQAARASGRLGGPRRGRTDARRLAGRRARR